MTVPPRLRRAQRVGLLLLLLSGMVSFIDRSALAIANPLIRAELGLSLGEMGLLLSVFLLAYSFAQLPTGWLVDRFGPRRVLTSGLILWSLAQGLGGLVSGFGQFIATRLLLGIGEAPQFMSCVRFVRDWFDEGRRGLPNGILGSSSSLGLAVAGPLLTWLMLAFGWRAMFLTMGAAGLLVAALWFAFYRDADPASLTGEERAYLFAGETEAPVSPVSFAEWRRLLRQRATWSIILGFFGTVYISTIYMTWLPAYLEIDRHMSIFKTGFAASIPFFFGVAGSIGGGLLADFLTARNVSPLTACKVPVVGGLAGAALLTLPVAEIDSNALAIACIAASVFLGYASTGAAWTLICVVAPKNYVGSLAGMKNFGGYFGGALAPSVTGFTVQATGSFELALSLGASVGFAGALCYFFGVDRPIAAIADTRHGTA